MTNAYFNDISDYRDIESINAYHDMTGDGTVDPDTMMRYLHYKSRDNARTPMQWNTKENAGFTTGTPWIAVNPNYKTINAEEQLQNPNSVFHYYQKLIQLRKEHDIIVYGHYALLLPDDEEIYAYTREWEGRELLVICNFSQNTPTFAVPEAFTADNSQLLIANYDCEALTSTLTLRPYEARVYLKG